VVVVVVMVVVVLVVMVVVRCPTVQVFVFDEFVVIAEGNSVWS